MLKRVKALLFTIPYQQIFGWFMGWLGVGAISYGAGQVYPPAFWITAGGFAVAHSYITARAIAFKKGQ